MPIDALHAELVRRDDPAAWVREADAVEASLRRPRLALRGPVFGKAAEEFRALGRADDRVFRICRIERMLRLGPTVRSPGIRRTSTSTAR